MLLFRSEDHVDRWCRGRGIPRGESFSIEQGWQLAQAFYVDRLSPDWRRRSPEEYEVMFRAVNLTSSFWSLRP